jgi:ABC-2 type transport system permease protein
MKQFFLKWFGLFKFKLKASNAYKFNTLSYLLAQLVVLATTVIVWYSNIRSGSTLLTMSEVVTYYVVGQIFLLQIDPHWSSSEDIQYGKFSSKLLKPTSIWGYYWIEDAAVNFFSNLVKLVIALAMFFLLNSYIQLPTNIGTILFFILSIIIGYFINLSLSLLFGFLAFYSINVHGILEFFTQVRIFSSGYLFPLNIARFLGFLQFLPFALTYYFPMQIWLEKTDINQNLLIISGGIAWLLILYLLTTVMYKFGLKRYESVGL